MATPQITLYTCITNKRDKPKHIEYRDEIRYVLFSDIPEITAEGWEVLPLHWTHTDPVRTARFHKHNPFTIFPDIEYSIWLDATHWPYSSLMSLVGPDFSLMKHLSRNLVIDEMKACSKYQMDDIKLMESQQIHYTSKGFQDDQGLFSTTCLVRRNTALMREFAEFWWNEICTWSRRDQLSLPYCLWRFGIKPEIIAGVCRKGFSPYFRMISHYVPQVSLL